MDEVRSSLGFRLLVRMVIRVSLVLLLVTTLAYAYVYRCVQTIALGDLRSYVAEHGEYENQLFTETQGHLQQLRQAYVNGLAMPATNASDVSRWIHFQPATIKPIIGKTNEVGCFAAIMGH